MGYESFSKSQKDERKPHPVWRGIGFLLLVLTPILSFALADIIVQYVKLNVRGARFPKIFQPDVNIPIYGMVNDWPLVLVVTVFISLALFSIFSVFNAIAYRSTRDKNKTVFESDRQSYKRKRKLKKPKYKP